MSDPTHGITAAPAPPVETPQTIDLSKPIITLPNGLTVRHMRHSDAARTAHHANNPLIARNMRMRWPVPYSVDRAHDWIALCRNESNWRAIGPASTAPPSSPTTVPGTVGTGPRLPTAWAICLDDQPMGGIGLDFQSDVHSLTLPFGYWVGEEYWGRGIMSTVLPAFIEWVWESYPWIIKLEPSVYGWNPGSARVLEKAGFVLEGRMKNSIIRYGVVGDVLVYGLLRKGIAPSSGEPPTPATGPEKQQDDGTGLRR